MASAWLGSKTGEGSTTGKRGTFATELWFVQLDNVKDSPSAVMAAERPLGTPHPDPMFQSARVVDYQPIEHTDNPLIWRVLVIYQTDQSIGGGSFGGWRVSTRWETRTDHLTRSVAVAATRNDPGEEGELIGPHHYVIHDPETGPTPLVPTHIAPDPTTGTDIELIQTSAIRPVGFDRVTTAMHFTFTNTVQSMTFGTLRFIHRTYGGKVNAKEWKGFAPATLLFTGFSEDEQTSIDPYRASPTNVYPVNIEFAYNPEGWTPATFVETYQTAGGVEVAVQRVLGFGEPGPAPALEFSHYRVYEEASIDQVFAVLSRGELPDDPKQKWRLGDAPPRPSTP